MLVTFQDVCHRLVIIVYQVIPDLLGDATSCDIMLALRLCAYTRDITSLRIWSKCYDPLWTVQFRPSINPSNSAQWVI